MPDFSTKLSINAGSSQDITLKPSYYTLFAYYAHLIDEVFMLRHENMEEIKHFYTYVQGLGFIGEQLFNNGPLKNFSERDIDNLISTMPKDAFNDWDGSMSDSMWDEHTAQFALALNDIEQAKALFSQIIMQESKRGRNRDRTLSIRSLCYALRESFLNNPYAKLNYEDLWAYNKDVFGVDLYIHRIMTLIADTKEADTAYHDFVEDHLFNNPLLDDPLRGFSNHGNDIESWTNILYRVDAITFDLVSIFLTQHLQYTQLTGNTPTNAVTPGVNRVVTDAIMGNQQDRIPGSGGVRYGDIPLSTRGHQFSDAQLNKIVNFMIGGGKLKGVEDLSAKMSEKIHQLLGNRVHLGIPLDEMDELRAYYSTLVDELLARGPQATAGKVDTGNVYTSSVINLALFGVVAYATYGGDQEASFESQLRLGSVFLGVTSDMGNAVALKYHGVKPTLFRSVAAASSKPGLSLTLGRLAFLAGGAGGAIGATWFIYDSIKGFAKGNTKDAVLDFISAFGVGVNMLSLILYSTGAGIPLGLVCNAAGFSIMLVAQLIKWFGSEMEDLCLEIYGSSLSEGGFNKFKQWEDELKERTIAFPIGLDTYDIVEQHEQLIKRVETFLKDWDAFDEVEDK